MVCIELALMGSYRANMYTFGVEQQGESDAALFQTIRGCKSFESVSKQIQSMLDEAETLIETAMGDATEVQIEAMCRKVIRQDDALDLGDIQQLKKEVGEACDSQTATDDLSSDPDTRLQI